MKPFCLIICIAALLFSPFLYAQSGSAIKTNIKLPAEFDTIAEEWRKAYNSGDAPRLQLLYAENARYVSSHVPGLEANGRDALIANFKNGITAGGHVDFIKILNTEISKELAMLFCLYQATNNGQTVQGRNLLILRKIEGKWLIVMHMTVE